MTRHWTFGQKLGAGFAVTVMMACAIGIITIVSLRSVVESKDHVLTTNAALLLDAEYAVAAIEAKVGASRGYLLAREERFLEQMQLARGEFAQALVRLKRVAYTDEGRALLEVVEKDEATHQEALDRVIAMRRGSSSVDEVIRTFDELTVPRREHLRTDLKAFTDREARLLDEAKRASTDTAASAITLTVALTAGAALFAALVAFALARGLSRQIGEAVGQVQSSSTELQAAANQQASSSKEQSTAMSEISTTIKELLATSRQIAESAQRVAQIADQTATSARSGEGTVQGANESTVGIRRQVDLIVGHMLELGKKSQQIGAVLEIVSELAEQTNILAINATIEAAGAGESGKRFGVVADEIRKLADRVAFSAKEIRTLIEEVRGAVNTTVMTTETGSKAVDSGTQKFTEVVTSFKQIAELVTNTTEAAREIELSTKQQTTAVEQVNVAIANLAQASKETEVSSGQTLKTASLLASLSGELLRLVQPRAGA